MKSRTLNLTMHDSGTLVVFNFDNVEMYIGFDGYSVIHLTSGKAYNVLESAAQIDAQVIQFV